jgi:hypothetical protein
VNAVEASARQAAAFTSARRDICDVNMHSPFLLR